MKNRFLIVLLLLTTSMVVSAQTVEWTTKPIYDNIQLVQHGLFKVTVNGKCGLITESGTVVVPVEYDNITEFKDGKALVTDKMCQTLIGVVYGKEKTFSKLDGYSIDSGFPYFSDGKLAVKKNEKWGFINENLTECQGHLACTNMSVLPFSDGCTFIYLDGVNHGYFDTNGNPLMGNFNSKMVEGYSYFNGKALTFNSNLSWSIVDKVGNVLVDIKAPKQKFMPTKNGHTITHGSNTFVLNEQWCLVSTTINGNTTKYDDEQSYHLDDVSPIEFGALSITEGYMTDILFNGEKIIPSQFNAAMILDNSHVAVKKNGKWGIIKVYEEGKMTVSFASSTKEFNHSIPDKVTLTIKKPTNLASKILDVSITDENDAEVDINQKNESNDVKVSFSLSPELLEFEKSREVAYKVVVSYEGIKYVDKEMKMTYWLREGFTASCSKREIYADSTGVASVSVFVKNISKTESANTNVTVSCDNDYVSRNESFAPGKSISIPIEFSTVMVDDFIDKTFRVKISEDGFPTITRSFNVRVNRYIPKE